MAFSRPRVEGSHQKIEADEVIARVTAAVFILYRGSNPPGHGGSISFVASSYTNSPRLRAYFFFSIIVLSNERVVTPAPRIWVLLHGPRQAPATTPWLALCYRGVGKHQLVSS